MPTRLTSDKILIVEGTHEEKFFSQLLNHINISTVQILPQGGKTCFKSNLEILRSDPLCDSLTAIGIIRDADNDYTGAFNSIRAILANSKFPVPTSPFELTGRNPIVSVFITPNNHDSGALETLCMESVLHDPIIDCVSTYMNCLENVSGRIHPHRAKAELQVFLAKEEEGDVSLSTACSKNIFDWGSPSFESIRQFLNNLYL